MASRVKRRVHGAVSRREAGWIQSCASTPLQCGARSVPKITLRVQEQQTERPAELWKTVSLCTSKRHPSASQPQSSVKVTSRSSPQRSSVIDRPASMASEKYRVYQGRSFCPSLASSDSKLAATPPSDGQQCQSRGCILRSEKRRLALGGGGG